VKIIPKDEFTVALVRSLLLAMVDMARKAGRAKWMIVRSGQGAAWLGAIDRAREALQSDDELSFIENLKLAVDIESDWPGPIFETEPVASKVIEFWQMVTTSL